jgi:hypothetical protein
MQWSRFVLYLHLSQLSHWTPCTGRWIMLCFLKLPLYIVLYLHLSQLYHWTASAGRWILLCRFKESLSFVLNSHLSQLYQWKWWRDCFAARCFYKTVASFVLKEQHSLRYHSSSLTFSHSSFVLKHEPLKCLTQIKKEFVSKLHFWQM